MYQGWFVFLSEYMHKKLSVLNTFKAIKKRKLSHYWLDNDVKSVVAKYSPFCMWCLFQRQRQSILRDCLWKLRNFHETSVNLLSDVSFKEKFTKLLLKTAFFKKNVFQLYFLYTFIFDYFSYLKFFLKLIPLKSTVCCIASVLFCSSFTFKICYLFSRQPFSLNI